VTRDGEAFTNASGIAIVVAAEAGLAVRAFEDIADVVGASLAAGALVLTEDDVDPAFFDLRSGWAGELFQKATNYGVRLALVLPDPGRYGPRWRELAFEHTAHRVVRFVPSRAAAEAWLGAAGTLP
jgi:hypothetical protein